MAHVKNSTPIEFPSFEWRRRQVVGFFFPSILSLSLCELMCQSASTSRYIILLGIIDDIYSYIPFTCYIQCI